MKTKKYVEMVEKPLSLLAEKMSRKIFLSAAVLLFSSLPHICSAHRTARSARERERKKRSEERESNRNVIGRFWRRER